MKLADLRCEPRQVEKAPPCVVACAVGGDVRGWVGAIAQRRKLGMSDEQAFTRAWSTIVEANPFPATLGRICPHPCESRCNRGALDGAVAINALERFLGDWALRQGLPLPMPNTPALPESIGVVGAGPAGLSFAYQMARRGYRVTVYEKRKRAGGMLSRAIPQFRLPADVFDREVRRLLDVGIELRTQTAIGPDMSAAELRRLHRAVFVGIGASCGARLAIPGEAGEGVWTGVDYLSAMKRGEAPAAAARVIVIGGGNTAIDAARVARRAGASATIVYRRTLAEMPAIASEVHAALSEGVTMECLSSPVSIERSGGVVVGVVVQRTRLGEADSSGRRRSIPIEDTERVLRADLVIAAVSQASDWSGLEPFQPLARRAGIGILEAQDFLVFVGGDVLEPNIAGFAIAQGRRAADAVHSKLRGLSDATTPRLEPLPVATVKVEDYPLKERVRLHRRLGAGWLPHQDVEVEQTLSEQGVLGEAERCLSCGSCNGCQRCFMYCTPGAMRRLEPPQLGAYYAVALDSCDGCGKCVELCPTGFMSCAVPRFQTDPHRASH